MAERLTVEVGAVAHGGHFVAKTAEGVVFIRHAAPGEQVVCEVTRSIQGGRVKFADAVEILKPSQHRIEPPCSVAGTCGGCDFLHLDLPYQRELKTEVLRTQLVRLGKIESDSELLSVEVSPLGSDDSGLGWRTRVEYHTDDRGRTGFFRQHSKTVVPVSSCPLVVDQVTGDGVVNRPFPANSEVRVVAPTASPRVVLTESEPGGEIVERVGANEFHLDARGFWQAHRNAPEVFSQTVMNLLKPVTGEHVVELYAGVGLFALPIAQAVGAGGRVDAVEGERGAARHLRRNARTLPQVNPVASEVQSWLKTREVRRADAVVLDPPRSGAGEAVLSGCAAFQPKRIVYVACDPAAFARDVHLLAGLGYRLSQIEAFDAFPNTQHFESFGLFTRE